MYVLLLIYEHQTNTSEMLVFNYNLNSNTRTYFMSASVGTTRAGEREGAEEGER